MRYLSLYGKKHKEDHMSIAPADLKKPIEPESFRAKAPEFKPVGEISLQNMGIEGLVIGVQCQWAGMREGTVPLYNYRLSIKGTDEALEQFKAQFPALIEENHIPNADKEVQIDVLCTGVGGNRDRLETDFEKLEERCKAANASLPIAELRTLITNDLNNTRIFENPAPTRSSFSK